MECGLIIGLHAGHRIGLQVSNKRFTQSLQLCTPAQSSISNIAASKVINQDACWTPAACQGKSSRYTSAHHCAVCPLASAALPCTGGSGIIPLCGSSTPSMLSYVHPPDMLWMHLILITLLCVPPPSVALPCCYGGSGIPATTAAVGS